jgi:hypothetical protein
MSLEMPTVDPNAKPEVQLRSSLSAALMLYYADKPRVTIGLDFKHFRF